MKIGIAALCALLAAGSAIAGQPPTAPQAPAQPAPSSLPAMQPWTDPVEHAFTLQVPAGWQISGGTHRNAPIDARNPVVAQSPDGRITIFIDDPAILPRQTPHPAYMQMGWTEGRTVQGPAGPLKIERFQTGAQFAEFYSGVKCPGAKKEASFDLKAESQMLSTSIAPMATQMGGNAEVSAGEIYYRCGPKAGYTKSVTVLAYKPGNGPRNWAVYKLAGYMADPGSIDVARTVMNIMVATMKLDPNWEAALQRQINDTTGAIMAMSNRITQETIQRAQQQAAQMEQRLKQMPDQPDVMSGWEKNQKVYDDISQKRSDAMLGQIHGCDDVGRCSTQSNEYQYHWVGNDGSVIPGPSDGSSPGMQYHPFHPDY